MNAQDYVYRQILTGALDKGASETMAKNNATLGLEEYKKNRFSKPDKLIQEKIKEAVRQSRR
jgi:hypothetical protein